MGGDRINYPGEVATPTAEMLVAKLLFNSTISTKGARFMTMDISNFYLNSPLPHPELLSRECLNLKCLPKPSFADMVCRVGDMSATCLRSCRRLGDIACRLECLNDTTFDDMSPTLCTTEVHDCFVRGDFDRETMASSPAGSYHGLWWTDALDPVHLRDPHITGNAAM